MVLMFKEVYFYDDDTNTNYLLLLLLVIYKLHLRLLCKD